MSPTEEVLAQARDRIKTELDEARASLDEAARRALVALEGLQAQENKPLSTAVISGSMTDGEWFFKPDSRFPHQRRGIPVRKTIYGIEMTREVEDGDYDLVVLVYPRPARPKGASQ